MTAGTPAPASTPPSAEATPTAEAAPTAEATPTADAPPTADAAPIAGALTATRAHTARAHTARAADDAVVIGAGIGGLCAAIALAAAGRRVTVIEALDHVGGKAATATVDGVTFDTGPSVLTMPDAFDRVLRLAGTSLGDHVELLAPTPAFHYHWPEQGVTLPVHHSLTDTLGAVAATLGDDAAGQLDRFLTYAGGIWQAAAPHFIHGPAPTVRALLRIGPRALLLLPRIDPLRSMRASIERHVQDPHLRDLLMRYATYNGSNALTAPATLNCIAWVELADGAWGVRGGIGALVSALHRVATSLGVVVRLATPATRIELDGDRVVAVHTATDRLAARTVVVNADVQHLVRRLLPPDAAPAPRSRRQLKRLARPQPASTSGWTAVIRARRRPDRPAHAVVFPTDYRAEFVDMFERERPPEHPTVYLCAQEKAHGRHGWAQHEPLFVMANAPAEPADAPTDPAVWERLRARTLDRLVTTGLIDPDDEVVWSRTPTDLAATFPDSRGSIYGAASSDRMAAFRRPANRLPAPRGLYLASGGAHPGGGLPLCALSGLAAANAALAEDPNGAPTRHGAHLPSLTTQPDAPPPRPPA